MFKSIYKKIQEDYSFLQTYNYKFNHISKHNVHPGVVFNNANSLLQIIFDYEESKTYVIWYENKTKLRGENLLQNIELKGKTYKEQVGQVQEFLKNYLENR